MFVPDLGSGNILIWKIWQTLIVVDLDLIEYGPMDPEAVA